jgi:hypothetical protein
VRPLFDTDYPVVTVLPPTVAEVAAPVAAAEGVVVEGAAAEGATPAAGETGEKAAEGAKPATGGKEGKSGGKKG